MKCKHEVGGEDWLASQNGIVKLHPYCGKCGVVKNISSDKGRSMGYFMKCLSQLRRNLQKFGYKVSEAQIRLISNELCCREEFIDNWWVSFSQQKELYAKAVKKYVNVSKEVVIEPL